MFNFISQVRDTSLRNLNAKTTATETEDDITVDGNSSERGERCGNNKAPSDRDAGGGGGGHNSSEVALITEPEASVTPPSSTSSRKVGIIIPYSRYCYDSPMCVYIRLYALYLFNYDYFKI